MPRRVRHREAVEEFSSVQTTSKRARRDTFSGDSRPIKRRRVDTPPKVDPPPKRLHDLPNEIRENIFKELVTDVGIAEAFTKYSGVCSGFNLLITQEIIKFQPTENFCKPGDDTALRILLVHFAEHLISRVKSPKRDTVVERLIRSVKNEILAVSSNKDIDEMQLQNKITEEVASRSRSSLYAIISNDSRYDDIANDIRQNVLIVAITLADEDLVRKMLAKGADLWTYCPAFSYPLCIALDLETTAMVDFILGGYSGTLPEQADDKILKALSQFGKGVNWGDIRARSKLGSEPKHNLLALHRMVDWLLERDSWGKSDAQIEVLLELTLRLGRFDNFIRILEGKFRPIKDIQIALTAYFRYPPNKYVLRKMIQMGFNKQTIYTLAGGRMKPRYLPNHPHHYTALQHAIHHGDLNCARMILTGPRAASADEVISHDNKFRHAPLCHAIQKGDEGVVRLLLAHRADPEGPAHVRRIHSDPESARCILTDLEEDGLLEACEVKYGHGRDSPNWKLLVRAIEWKVEMCNHSYFMMYPDKERSPAGSGYTMPENCRKYYKANLPRRILTKMDSKYYRPERDHDMEFGD